jgi:hypothetical protein
LVSSRCMPINIYARCSAFFPGGVFKLAKCSKIGKQRCRFCQSIFTRAAPLLFLVVRLGWLICYGACGVGTLLSCTTDVRSLVADSCCGARFFCCVRSVCVPMCKRQIGNVLCPYLAMPFLLRMCRSRAITK